MGNKRRSAMLQKVSNLIKISIFIAKMRLIHLKKSTKFSKFKSLKHYNGFLQFSPSSTPLISFHLRKVAKGSPFYYSVCCFNGRAHVEMEKDCLELSYDIVEEEDSSVDERAERFIQRFYEEMKRQRRESLSSSPNLPFNRMLTYSV